MSQQVAEIQDDFRRVALTDVAINTYLNDYDKASPAYKKFIVHELDALGYDRDYSPLDHGTGYAPARD